MVLLHNSLQHLKKIISTEFCNMVGELFCAGSRWLRAGLGQGTRALTRHRTQYSISIQIMYKSNRNSKMNKFEDSSVWIYPSHFDLINNFVTSNKSLNELRNTTFCCEHVTNSCNVCQMISFSVTGRTATKFCTNNTNLWSKLICFKILHQNWYKIL